MGDSKRRNLLGDTPIESIKSMNRIPRKVLVVGGSKLSAALVIGAINLCKDPEALRGITK